MEAPLTLRPRFGIGCVTRAVPVDTTSLCIFACSGPGPGPEVALSPEVRAYITELAVHFGRVVVVVAVDAMRGEGGVDEASTARLGIPDACVCTAPNGMRDFGLFWRVLTGLLVAGRRRFDRVALVNDSAALVRPLESVVAWGAAADRPYWGVSKSMECGVPHVQSYFTVLAGRAVARLFEHVAEEDAFTPWPPSMEAQRREAIARFEIGLARRLRTAGILPEAPFSSPSLAQMRWDPGIGGYYGENPALTMWDRMLAAGAPTLKHARLRYPGSDAFALPPLVSTSATMFVYISCHDDASEREARHMARHVWRIDDDPLSSVVFVRLPASPFLESAIYDILYERRGEWERADYVCLLTYSIARKLEAFGGPGRAGAAAAAAPAPGERWRRLRQSLAQTTPDVAGLCRIDFLKKSVGGVGVPVSVLEGAVFQHGLNFYRAWHALLRAMGLDEDAIVDPTVPGFFCNWWVARPWAMKSYIAFYRRAAALVRADRGLAALMGKDACYDGTMTHEQLVRTFEGRTFYPVQPFVFERLPSFFYGRLRPAPRIAVIEPRFVMRLKE